MVVHVKFGDPRSNHAAHFVMDSQTTTGGHGNEGKF